MTKYICVYCDGVLPAGANSCATCNEIDGCLEVRRYVVEETHRYTVEAGNEIQAMQFVNDHVADCPAISITKVEEIKTFFAVNYSATYLVEADTEEAAIQKAILEHEEMPDGDWSAEETTGLEWGVN